MSKIQSLFFIIGLFTAIFYSCRQSDTGRTITVKALTVYGDTIYLESLSFEGNIPKKVDSVVIHQDDQEVVWHIPSGDEALYKLRSKKMIKASFVWIADANKIMIDANFMSPVFKITGSKATTTFIKYVDIKTKLAETGRQIGRKADSLAKAGASKIKLDRNKLALNRSLIEYFDFSKKFADTVSSPAVFLLVYYNIDFGPEHGEMKSFIVRNAARFPKFQPIQQLKKEEVATIKIFEEEYQVGDKLPAITLPDQNGFAISTASYKGSYYIIDFWSSWCTQCLPFKEAERNLLKKIPGKIKVVSVAIDSEKEDWSKMVFANQYTWPQLIDVAMWKGTAVQTMKIDSIPFNFLVGPDGKVIAKALNAHNLESTVMAKVK